MDDFLTIHDYLDPLFITADKLKSGTNDTQVINGLGEVEINGVIYQIQLVLEPREKYFTKETAGTTCRKIVEE
ncbi:MAG TPA: hypothetical protein VIV55_09895 [Flavobacterium sp.]